MDAPRTRFTLLGALAAGLLVVFFCLLLLWHNPLVFWNDDYELSVLPVFADVARSWSEGHWPILSPKCDRHFHLEISVDVSAASSRAFNHAPFCLSNRCVFACPRSPTLNSIVDLRRARRVAKRLDHLLGRD